MKRIILAAILLALISTGNSYAQNADNPVPEPQVMVATSQTNLNNADAKTLDALPGVGPVLAERIIDYREENGPFQSIDDLIKVKGIGAATVEKMKANLSL